MWKKIALWGLCGGVVLVALALITNAFILARQGGQLEQRIAELQSRGAPVTLSDLQPDAPVDADENAAELLKRAEVGLNSINASLYALYEDEDFQARRFNAVMKQQIRQALAKSPEALLLVHRAANAPKYQSRLRFSDASPDVLMNQAHDIPPRVRGALRILNLEASLQIDEQQADDAMKTSFEQLRLSRLTEAEPMLICYLVSLAGRAEGVQNANRALRAGPVSEESHAVLSNEIAAHDLTAGFAKVLHAERAFNMDATVASNWLTQTVMNHQRIGILDMYQDFENQFREQGLSATFTPSGGLSTLLAPALSAAQQASLRTEAYLRCLRVVNAAVAKGDDDWKLDELELSDEHRTDPFNGEPLKLRKGEGGWVVYSVGPDRVDDGGSTDDGKDIGLGP